MILFTNRNPPRGEFGFWVSPQESAGQDHWEQLQDEVVYQAQMATGMYRGSIPLHEVVLKVLRERTKRGLRQPYYGAFNVSVCSYSFEISGATCRKTITHAFTEQKRVGVFPLNIRRWPIFDNPACFRVDNEWLEGLRKWENWRAEDALSERYSYTFEGLTIGLVLCVNDKFSGDLCRLLPFNF